MKKISLNAYVIDGNKVIPLKIKYDPSKRIAEYRKLFRVMARFDIDPNHIYELQKRGKPYIVFIDNAKRTSITIPKTKKIVITEGNRKEVKEETINENVEVIQSVKPDCDSDLDMKKSTKLDYLIDVSFWRSIWAKRKIPLSTLLITLLAGMGIYHLLVLVLRACGINV
jgi:hypothetical protein